MTNIKGLADELAADLSEVELAWVGWAPEMAVPEMSWSATQFVRAAFHAGWQAALRSEAAGQGWRPIEEAPKDGWLVGRRDKADGEAPGFVGKVYKNPFVRSGTMVPGLDLIDPWSGKWKRVTAWMPLPTTPAIEGKEP